MATKIGMEILQGLRYKLMMMGIPISVTSPIYVYNMLGIHNIQISESTFK